MQTRLDTNEPTSYSSLAALPGIDVSKSNKQFVLHKTQSAFTDQYKRFREQLDNNET